MDTCNSKHDCFLRETPLLLKRVIDIGESPQQGDPILLETTRRYGWYAALSYCWGKGQRTMTTQKTVAQFSKGIPMSELSQSLQDAIRITRRLGRRYIWIDALCIIQMEQDLKDFEEESVKMAEYYGNAYITIAAASAASNHDGLLSDRTDVNPFSCELQYSRPCAACGVSEGSTVPSMGTIYASLPSSHDIGPLILRGWTFQEAVLSHRILVYGKTQIMWKCRRLECSEDGLMEISSGTSYYSPYRWPNSSDSLPEKASSDKSSSRTVQKTPQVKEKLLRDWYNLLRQYITRKIGDSNDRMTAMAGITQSMATYLDSRYLFGIWKTDIIRGLLWRNSSGLGEALNAVPLRRAIRRAPTWSWTCVDGSIHVEQYERVTRKYRDPQNLRAEILGSRIVGTGVWDPIRASNEVLESNHLNKLFIKGTLKRARRSHQDFLTYSFKQRWEGTFWLPRRRKCFDVVTLLEAPLSVMEISTVQKNIVGIAVFDTSADKSSGHESFYCLRLTVSLGLLLVRVEDSINFATKTPG